MAPVGPKGRPGPVGSVGQSGMGFVVVSDLDRALRFYVEAIGAEVLEAPSATTPARGVVRTPGTGQCLTLVEQAGVPDATPDDAGLWRTGDGDLLSWFRAASGRTVPPVTAGGPRGPHRHSAA